MRGLAVLLAVSGAVTLAIGIWIGARLRAHLDEESGASLRRWFVTRVPAYRSAYETHRRRMVICLVGGPLLLAGAATCWMLRARRARRRRARAA